VEIAAKVGDTLLSESPVVPVPAEGLLNVAAALQALHDLDELEVANLADEVVLGGKEVLLGDHDTLTEEVSVHEVAVLLGNDHRQQTKTKTHKTKKRAEKERKKKTEKKKL